MGLVFIDEGGMGGGDKDEDMGRKGQNGRRHKGWGRGHERSTRLFRENSEGILIMGVEVEVASYPPLMSTSFLFSLFYSLHYLPFWRLLYISFLSSMHILYLHSSLFHP